MDKRTVHTSQKTLSGCWWGISQALLVVSDCRELVSLLVVGEPLVRLALRCRGAEEAYTRATARGGVMLS